MCGWTGHIQDSEAELLPAAETSEAELGSRPNLRARCGARWKFGQRQPLALRVCEPLCGECAVQRSILSPGTAKLRRVQRTKQSKRSRGSGLPFASPLRRAQQKQGTATTRGKEFLSRACGQKWVPPGACRFCDTLAPLPWKRRGVLLGFALTFRPKTGTL